MRIPSLFVLTVLLAGCSTSSTPSPVRRIRFIDVTADHKAAERARNLSNRLYPKVVGLLGNPSQSPRRFDIVFTSLKFGNTAETHSKGPVLYLNSDYFLATPGKPLHWLARHPAYADNVVVHELAHVAQRYLETNSAPNYWVEGLADYVRYGLGYTNWAGPECGANYPHYKSGYWCAGAFLRHLATIYGQDVITQLDHDLRNDNYSDELFLRTTGKPLQELWSEFERVGAR